METKKIYFANSLEEARATLQAIVTIAQGYGNCLTDGVYLTNDVARSVIVDHLCRAYYHYIDCKTKHNAAGAAAYERLAVLDKVINENIKALPAPIREYLNKIEGGGVDIDADETDDDIDDVAYAADKAAKAADGDIEYTYKARLAGTAMCVYFGIFDHADLDPDDIYIGLRLTAVKLSEAISDATTALGLAACSRGGYTAILDNLNPVVSFSTMVAATQKARALLFAFTGADYRNTTPAHYKDDIEIRQVANVIIAAAAAVKDNDKRVDALISELCLFLDDLFARHPEEAGCNAYLALSVVQKLAALCNVSPEQQTPGVDDIRSSGVIGNALKE